MCTRCDALKCENVPSKAKEAETCFEHGALKGDVDDCNEVSKLHRRTRNTGVRVGTGGAHRSGGGGGGGFVQLQPTEH